MITPITKKLSKSILDNIEIDKIIYAEVTPPGAMGNSGGIYGGMGNNVFINKKINLSIQDNYFVYHVDDLEYQIFSSVQGVFNSVVNHMKSNKSTKPSSIKRISPKWIDKLEEDEIFVFGSNLDGLHGGGAAAVARKWGAIWGQGLGLHGQTYAIPTMQGGVETIKKYKPKILLEYNPGNMGQCGHSMEELNCLIDEINYEPFWFDNGENLFIQSR